MPKVLIAYFHAGGTTENMAGYIAEGVRIKGGEVVVKEISALSLPRDLAGYDGFIFGAPTYSQEIPVPMQNFLEKAKGAMRAGKPGGSFGPYTHEVGYSHEHYAPAKILDKMENSLKLAPFELGPLALRESTVDTAEGMHACQQYGEVFTQSLSA